jgi:hypothetical protein
MLQLDLCLHQLDFTLKQRPPQSYESNLWVLTKFNFNFVRTLSFLRLQHDNEYSPNGTKKLAALNQTYLDTYPYQKLADNELNSATNQVSDFHVAAQTTKRLYVILNDHSQTHANDTCS